VIFVLIRAAWYIFLRHWAYQLTGPSMSVRALVFAVTVTILRLRNYVAQLIRDWQSCAHAEMATYHIPTSSDHMDHIGPWPITTSDPSGPRRDYGQHRTTPNLKKRKSVFTVCLLNQLCLPQILLIGLITLVPENSCCYIVV